MTKHLRPVAVLFLLAFTQCRASTRIAFLPSFSDFEMQSPMRAALPTFDARLQAELLNGWNSEVLSRTGLSTVVFEQKLRAADDASLPVIRVLPSGFLVISVLDQSKGQLRVFVNRVGTGMTLGAPKVFPVKNPGDLENRLPGEVARHVAGIAGLARRPPAVPHRKQQGKPFVCTVLEPVSAGGARSDLSQISPLIHAVLENVIADDSTQATLVDRSETASILDEKTLTATNGLDANGAADLGRLAKADLILIPFIHFQNSKKIGTDLFAVDVATGRMLACRSWSGPPLAPPPAATVKELLEAGLNASRESVATPISDDPALRHAEAVFMISLKEGWAGLRQLAATEAELSIRLCDASLALASDEPAIMRKAVAKFYRAATPGALYPLQLEYNPTDARLREISQLKGTGQLDLIYRQARQVLELPLTELAKDNDFSDLQHLGEFWTRLGDAKKGWAILTRTGQPIEQLAARSPFYESLVVTLMNLGRYQECVDLLLRRQRWSSLCTTMILDAYRALKNPKREFDLMWVNPSSSCKLERSTVRFLDLGRDQGKSAEVIARVMATANAWVINSPAVRMAMIRARVSAGQEELAISDAQCALITAIKAKDTDQQKELTGILTRLGASTLASLPAARDFLTLPSACRIDLIHDQTEDAKHVNEVAKHIAGFWGCPVHVRAIHLAPEKFSSYRKLSQAMEANAFGDTLQFMNLPEGLTLGTILLTQTKMVSTKKNYKGDVYSVNRGPLLLLSDNYFRKYKSYDPRPLPFVTAIAAANLNGVRYKLKKQSLESRGKENVFSPMPPDLFATNGTLHMAALELGVSPATGLLLKQTPPSELLKSIQELTASSRARSPGPDPADRPLVLDINDQISKTKPTVINP